MTRFTRMNWRVITLGFAFMLAVLGSGLDNWTTYIALTEFAHGARELNPFAATTFRLVGMGTSLTVNFFVGLAAMIWIAQTSWIKGDASRVLILGFIGALRGSAALNNWYIITSLGG